MLPICTNINGIDNNSVFYNKKEKTQKKTSYTKPLLKFNNNKEKVDEIVPKYYTIDFGSIKRKNYVYDYTKKPIDIDKEIGATKQRKMNCWLLTGINAVASTKKGKEYIKNAIAYHDDKKTVVHLAGNNITVTIPQMVLSAAKQSKTYVNGDDDMLAFELATEYYKKMLIVNKNDINNPNPNVITGKYTSGNVNNPTAGGNASDIMFLLTGKRSKTIFNGKYTVPKKLKNALIQKQKSPDTCVLTCNFRSEEDGLITHHAYAIKKIDNKFVTLINPHNSGKEEKVTLKDFCKNVKSLTVLDL